MAFELASARGRFLKAKDSGLLDYAPGIDETAKFRVEAAVGGNVIYLAVKSHDHTVNRIGGVGWYLGLSSQGHLYCDGGKDLNSQWALVSAGPSGQSSIAGAVTNPLLAATPQLPESQTNHAARPPAFPGVDAGRDELLRFFLTSQGEAFLANPSYSEARHLYHQGLLQSILHRCS